MRFFFLILILFSSFGQDDTTRIRLLLRDETDAGVAGARLNLRTENDQTLHLMTDANGVIVSDELLGNAVWLIGGERADGRTLIADSYPVDTGFRLVLIPGQVRDALLRLDGDRIVLDPDMIFSPGDPGEIAPPTPVQLAGTAAPLSTATLPVAGAQTPNTPADENTTVVPNTFISGGGSALWIVLALIGGGVLLIILALLVGLVRRRQA